MENQLKKLNSLDEKKLPGSQPKPPEKPEKQLTAAEKKKIENEAKQIGSRNKIKPQSGILYIICPCCGKRIPYMEGKVKNPRIKKVDAYLERARCPECGTILRFKTPKPKKGAEGSSKKTS